MKMVDDEIRGALAKALKKAQKKGALPAFDLPADIPVERPKQEDMGDYASPVCMQLARFARMAPVKIAEAVVANMPALPFLAEVQVAHPGFINFRLSDAWLAEQVEEVLRQGQAYGTLDLGAGQSV